MVCLKAVTVTRKLNILCLLRVCVGGFCVPGQIHMASSAVLTYLRDFFLPTAVSLVTLPVVLCYFFTVTSEPGKVCHFSSLLPGFQPALFIYSFHLPFSMAILFYLNLKFRQSFRYALGFHYNNCLFKGKIIFILLICKGKEAVWQLPSAAGGE